MSDRGCRPYGGISLLQSVIPDGTETKANAYKWLTSSSDKATLKLIVRAEVRKGYSPLIGANVEVKVGSLQWKLMNDDGVGK